MIIKNICLLLEALSIIICLHNLYNEKIKLEIITVVFLSFDMIVMTAINFYGFSQTYMTTLAIYPIIALYCGVRFGFKFKSMISNIVLCVIIVGGIQIVGMLLVYFACEVQNFADYNMLFVNCFTFLIVTFILPIFKIYRLSRFSQDNGKLVVAVIGVCIAWLSFLLISYKNLKLVELRQAIMLFISIALVFALAGQLSKYKIRARETEMELRMHELYSEPFERLIDNIQLRQHEFDNHINAIYSQHFSYHTYEELVAVQKDYCAHITKDNRFNKLLAKDNSVIRGYLYAQFVEIDKIGIDISYNVSIKNLDIGIPIYKLVEILGNLINNAVEALKNEIEKSRLHVEIVETDHFFIEVRNESSYVNYNEINTFFVKNYSKKGETRGLGLHNVKQICEKYGLDISCENIEMYGVTWLSFKVSKKKMKTIFRTY